jgi:hypothetical protein
MRARILLAVPAAAVALATVGTSATPAAGTPSVFCSAASTTVLFWPHGHPAISSVHFPNIKTPHLEVYKPGATYPSGNFLLYADAKGGVDSAALCAHGPTAKVAAIASPKTIKTRRAVTCAATTNLIYDIKKSKKGITVTGRTVSFELWRAVVSKKGKSSLRYNSARCKLAASPH